MPISSTQQQQLLQLSVGVFGMSPGAVLMNEFANYIAGGGTVQGLAGALFATAAAQSSTFYATALTTEQFAAKLVDNVIGTAAAESAKTGLKAAVVSFMSADTSADASVKRGDAAYALITAVAAVDHADATWGNAAAQFDNKVEVAEYYTIAKSGDSTDLAILQATLSGVTNDHATVVTAKADIDSGIIVRPVEELELALTTATDAITAATGNEAFLAATGTLQNGDWIDGRDGVETLTVRDATGAGLATIRNIEQIHLISLGSAAALNLADATGYTSLDVWGSGVSATISNIGSGLDLTIGVLSGYGGDVTIGFQDESSADDTLNLYVNNASAFGLIESGHAIETIHLQAAGSGVAVTASVNPVLSTFAIGGTANVTLSIVRSGGTAAIAVNASALEGTLTFSIGGGTGATASSAGEFIISAGAGNDTITGGASKDTIEGGNGQDTMRGGGGSDVFVFLSSAGDTLADQRDSAQSDFIMDFASGDVIAFSGITTLTSLAGYTSLSGLVAVPSAISTATLVGQTLDTANYLAIYQASGNTYIEVGLNSAAAGLDSAIVTIVLDGLGGWTALSSVFNVSIGASGLYFQHV